MIIIAPSSSMIANAVRNIFKEGGILFPNRDRTPRVKAISVAIGMPIPDWVGVPQLKIKMYKGWHRHTPTAASTGNAAFFLLDNSPIYISRSISNPTIKKQGHGPSLIHSLMQKNRAYLFIGKIKVMVPEMNGKYRNDVLVQIKLQLTGSG